MENNVPAISFIGRQYRDEDGFYVAEVHDSALVSHSINYNDRLKEALELFHEIVQTPATAVKN